MCKQPQKTTSANDQVKPNDQEQTAAQMWITSKTKHTPGPWGYSQWPDQSIYNIHAGDYATAFATVKNVSNARGCMGSVETRANACLIAAAPELLEALQSLAYMHPDAELRTDPGLQAAVEHARAAIAKATGQP